MAAGATLLSEKPKETVRLEAHQTSDTGEVEIMRPNVSRSGGATLEGSLPGCGSWATAASAVEQKPHEGSVFCGIKTNTQGLNRN